MLIFSRDARGCKPADIEHGACGLRDQASRSLSHAAARPCSDAGAQARAATDSCSYAQPCSYWPTCRAVERGTPVANHAAF